MAVVDDIIAFIVYRRTSNYSTSGSFLYWSSSELLDKDCLVCCVALKMGAADDIIAFIVM